MRSRTKAARKWIGVSLLLAVVLGWVVWQRPGHRPLAASFVGYTNASGGIQYGAVFVISNRGTEALFVKAFLQTPLEHGWPDEIEIPLLDPYLPAKPLRARESRTINIDLSSSPWGLRLESTLDPNTPGRLRRARWAAWLRTRGMTNLGGFIAPRLATNYLTNQVFNSRPEAKAKAGWNR